MSANPLLPKPREMWVELLSGDYEPRKQELERQITEATEAERHARAGGTVARFGQASTLPELTAECDRLTAEYDALMGQAREEGFVRIMLRAAGRPWRQLKDEHPPRADNEVDEALGVNRATFFEKAVRLCIAEPEVTDEQYDEFVEGLSAAQWDRVASTAWQVNEGETAIPKSSAVSLLRAMRDDASKSAETTESILEPSTENLPSSDTTTPTEF